MLRENPQSPEKRILKRNGRRALVLRVLAGHVFSVILKNRTRGQGSGSHDKGRVSQDVAARYTIKNPLPCQYPFPFFWGLPKENRFKCHYLNIVANICGARCFLYRGSRV